MQKFQPCKSEFAYLALCSTDIFFIVNSQLLSILTKGHDKSLFVLYDLAFSHMYQLHVYFSVIDESSTTSLFLFFFLKPSPINSDFKEDRPDREFDLRD